MDESSASGGGRGRNKRFWTLEEDKVLVAALCDLATDPHWKCENGFRNGYMVRLEEVIGKALPGCGLKASPYIDSRLKTLVTKFRAFVQMLGTSGFMWDDEKNMISVERSVYDEFCKVHPNCKNLYRVAFPHLNDLMMIYGNDYASGKSAKGFVDAISNMEKTTPIQVALDSSDDDEVVASGNANETVESAPPSKKLKLEKHSKRKGGRKGSDGAKSSSGSEIASLQEFMKDMKVHLSTMANMMARSDDREQKLAELGEQVLEELLSLEGITTMQAFDIANILTSQPNKLMLFSKCPKAHKGSYAKKLLGEIGDGNV